MAYVHPVLGSWVVLLVFAVGLMGLRSRMPRSDATTARRRHTRFAPMVWTLCGVVLLLGLGSTALLREDLDVGTSTHLIAGVTLFALLTLARFVSRRVSGSKRARTVHPWIGMAALVAAVAVAILGMDLLPY